jgi:uncharacterized protein YecE (DUF72 family)
VAGVYIGTSGWAYKHWRGLFYPPGLKQREELRYIARQFNSLELNGSFYSLQRPTSYQQWAAETPRGFVFAIKGSRFITHNKKLKDVDAALANFFASGVLALNEKLGPIVWQLPERVKFDADRFERFFAMLPRDTEAAVAIARQHDARVEGRSWTETDRRRVIRHALEPRHPEFVTAQSIDLLRHYGVALVVADSGTWPRFEEVTTDFMYLRLHGSPHTYASQYTSRALEEWAGKIEKWKRGRDVYVYFDNDGQAHAPQDAQRLAERLEGKTL